MIHTIREAGPRALLLELETLDEVLACHQQLAASPLPGQVDAVAAARTILLRFTSRPALRAAREALSLLEIGEFSAQDARIVELEVIYDGEDLEELATHLGMSAEALVNWHSGQDWTGAFGGFAPGFTYCVPSRQGSHSTGDAVDVPRRSSPRTAVPAGAVALAGEFSAVYPRISPGGWQLIGHTPAQLWDLSREEHGESPALVSPGDSVRYKPVTAHTGTSSATAEAPPPRQTADPRAGTPALSVVEPGLQTLIQDLGRIGHSDLGVSRAGVADEAAARQGNRLVGNGPQAAVLEVLHGGLVLRAETTVVLAVTGAQVPLRISSASADTVPAGTEPTDTEPADTEPTDSPPTDSSLESSSRPAPLCAPFALLAGDTLSLGAPEVGLRAVVAVRGGIAAQEVLGSVSADTMSGLGPAPLAADDSLFTAGPAQHAVGEPEAVHTSATLDDADPAEVSGTASRPPSPQLRFTYGPRHDWFSPEEALRLRTQSWTVTQASNRIGIRLDVGRSSESHDPAPLQRLKQGELPSEGVVRGSLQMPPSGTPVLFLNDHPVTGGYPVIGVVIDEDLAIAAQLVPGEDIRLVAVDPDTLEPLPLPTPDA